MESANESSAELESFTDGALALQRDRLIRLIQNDGRISSQGGSDNGVDIDSVLPSKSSESIYHIATDDLEDKIVEDDKLNKVFDYFRNFVTTKDFRKLVEKSDHNIVLTTMIGMFTINRERDSNGYFKFMTLTQRWFNKEDRGFNKTEKQKYAVLLKRGSVVTLKNRRGNFPVYEIWKKNGNNFFRALTIWNGQL